MIFIHIDDLSFIEDACISSSQRNSGECLVLHTHVLSVYMKTFHVCCSDACNIYFSYDHGASQFVSEVFGFSLYQLIVLWALLSSFWY